MNDVLTLKGISKSYHSGISTEITVLSGIDLTIKAGEVVGMIAPSGAGKSTLLHIAGLLDMPDSGTVAIAGTDQTGKSDRRRTRTRRQDVGFIYQFHHLLQEFSAQENVVLPQLANGVPKTQAYEYAQSLLGKIGLKDRITHRPSELSGGEQQRVAFCRALANKPKLLLADEPTGNLDPATSDTVFDALMELVRETGLSALIATHNLELAKQMDRVLRLENGVLVDA
jgi:lipoprotein-releasing system ATP-binding protein